MITWLKKRNNLKIVIILLLLFVPWVVSNYFDAIVPEQPSQEDLVFYEINPCKVSLFEFLLNNTNTIYQDHYQFRFNDISSITCFGKISGLTEIDSTFYISIGTNSFVNLFLQSVFWMLLLSFIKKGNTLLNLNKKVYFLSLILSSYYFSFSIYAEKKFYEQKFYLFELNNVDSYVLLFIFIFPIIKTTVDICIERFDNLINFLPGMYLLGGIYSGFNISIYSLVFLFFGFYSLLTKNKNRFINNFFVFSSFIWIINSTTRHSFNPGKLRGFTSSSYDFNATLSWCIFFIILLNALLFIFHKTKKKVDINKIVNNFIKYSIAMLSLGIIGSNFPIVNFLNYYYLGLQKYGVRLNNPFGLDEWGVKIPWRGIFPSAETIGEFYGIGILLILVLYLSSKEFKLFHLIGFSSLSLGLYFSNNRSTFLLIILITIFMYFKNYQVSLLQKGFLVVFFISIVLFLIGPTNLIWAYNASSSNILQHAISYSSEVSYSSFLNLLNNNFESGSIFWYIFSIFGYVSFLINRSELWGIFFSRYNPTFLEITFGSGPLNFGQLYGENIVKETNSFLLPHSSFLSFLLFFGILGLLFLLSVLIYKIINSRNKTSIYGLSIIFYLFINTFKNDSLNYLSSFCFYFFLIYVITNINNRKLFTSL